MAPSPRWGHGLAYDVARKRLVLFGGFYNSGVVVETWEWDGSSWTDLSPVNSPVSRWNHGLAYDAERARVVLFGGESEAGLLGDTWEWDGSAWTEVGQGNSPEARTELSLAYDAERKRVVLFGGRGSGMGPGGLLYQRMPHRPLVRGTHLPTMRRGVGWSC